MFVFYLAQFGDETLGYYETGNIEKPTNNILLYTL